VTVIIQNILWSKGTPHIANLSKSKVSERLEEMKKKGRGIRKEIMSGIMAETKKEMVVTKRPIIIASSTEINSS
jgi:hypothetical protein